MSVIRVWRKCLPEVAERIELMALRELALHHQVEFTQIVQRLSREVADMFSADVDAELRSILGRGTRPPTVE